MAVIKALTEGTKLVRKLYDSIDDKATNIPGRKTSSISVGTERQKRSKRKQKGTEAIAAGAIVEALGIPAKTLEQTEVDSRSNVSSRMKATARDATPPADKNYKKKMKSGGKIGRGCGAAMRGAGKVIKA